MASWEQLKKLDGQYMTESIEREPDVAEKYEQCMATPGFKEDVVKKIYQGLNGRDYWLRRNDFPYRMLTADIEHLILWFKTSLFNMTEAKQLLVQELNIDEQNIVVSCNITKLKSIPEIGHYHVFIRN